MKNLIIILSLFVLSAILSLYTVFSEKSRPSALPSNVFSPVYYGNSHENANIPTLSVSALSAALIDLKSGAVLFEKNGSERLPMASTTKIMTAKTVLSKMSLSDVVTVPKEATLIEGSSIYLKEGEKISVKDLLYGLLLESGNDAAFALAVACSGSEENFVKLMNKEAENLKLYDTNFANPHGLSAENHYTSALDLAFITKSAMKNDVFRKIVSTKNYISSLPDGTKRYFSNHNRLLKSRSDVIGVKTGYTKAAGRCLVTAASDGNSEYIAVTLNDRDDWRDHKNMFDFAFENFTSVTAAKKDTFALYFENVRFFAPEDVDFTVYAGVSPTMSYKAVFDGENSVCVEFFADGTCLGKFYLTQN